MIADQQVVLLTIYKNKNTGNMLINAIERLSKSVMIG